MKIAITGHTSGLGKYLHDKLKQNHEVVGFSRSNGFLLPDKFIEVLKEVESCDVFINNAYVNDIQARFIENLYNKVALITSGSMAADYTHLNKKYNTDKLLIENTHKKYKKISHMPMLLLKMGYLESYTQYESISYEEVYNYIVCWFENTRGSIIELDNKFYETKFVNLRKT